MKSILLSRWSEIRPLFEAALEQAAENQAAWLDQATADPLLRDAVRDLLAREAALDATDALGLHAAQPSPSADSAVDAPPAMLGRYRVLRELGRGGMGVVYLAEQPTPSRLVAIKRLAATVDAGTRVRFRREGELLARLSHPGIARIIEVAADAHGEPLLVMEYVEGRRLSLHARDLDRRERLQLLARIADAVEHAHACGIVHRDLKPANILVSAAGEPKVLDFGIGRTLAGEGATLTETGMLLGTPAYMAPEQALGEAHVDARADVWALGVIGYELLVDRLPLPVSGLTPLQALKVVAGDTPPPLSRIDRTLRGDLEVVIGTALAREPTQRYATAGALADDLRRYLAREPIRARRPGSLQRLMLYARRQPRVVAAIAVALFGLIGGSAMAVSFGLDAAHERDRAEAALAEARDTLQAMGRVFAAGNPVIAGRPNVAFQEVLAAAPAQLEGLPAPTRRAVHYAVALAQAQLGEDAAAVAGFAEAAVLAEHLVDPAHWAQARYRQLALSSELVPAEAMKQAVDALLADPRLAGQPLARAGVAVKGAEVAQRLYRFRRAVALLAEARESLSQAPDAPAEDPTLRAEIEVDLLLGEFTLLGQGQQGAGALEAFMAELQSTHRRLTGAFVGEQPRWVMLDLLATHLADALAGRDSWRKALAATLDARIARYGATHPSNVAAVRIGIALGQLQAIHDPALLQHQLRMARAMPDGSRLKLRLLLESYEWRMGTRGVQRAEIDAAQAPLCGGEQSHSIECTWAALGLARMDHDEGREDRAFAQLAALVARADQMPAPFNRYLPMAAGEMYRRAGRYADAMRVAEQAIRGLDVDPELTPEARDAEVFSASWSFRPDHCERVLELLLPIEARLRANPATPGDVLDRLLSTCEVRAGRDVDAALARLAPWWTRAQAPGMDPVLRLEVIISALEIHHVLGRDADFQRWAQELRRVEAEGVQTTQLDATKMPWLKRARSTNSP
jgi:predicted Ser/Thr protein kinase